MCATNAFISVFIRRGAVVKGVEHISTHLLVKIWVARVRVPLVLSVGILNSQKLHY